MAQISVIVPVYNVENHLERCLESLCAQTLHDIEILCVNDGSTDGSRRVLAACARRDERIVVLDRENGGLSAARNTGIDAATSPLVCFLDADDRFFPQACRRIVEVLGETGADVLTFGAHPYPREAETKWLNMVLSPRDIVYESFDSALLFEEASRPFAWRTACRSDFLHRSGVRFDESLAFGEDQVFDFAIYPRSSKTVLIAEKLYEYRVSRSGSLMDRFHRNPYAMMHEHVRIIERVFADWSSLKLPDGGSCLERHASRMLSWVVEFALYDSLSLDDGAWLLIADALRPTLRSLAAPQVLAACSRGERAILNAALEGGTVFRARRRVLAVRYYLEQRGLKQGLEAVRDWLRR
ncbi:glycosyltransferase family 2 protein [Collinsella sp. zg1085]|uniref:glycosyltransferase family 2 protein n=1 Tax=Collinsella sp. zg1085 TaxID=2844380 RepID=UPI001C0BD7D2|nr:glycosyltransferase family 2 protein [Collinsella sp. zg1085]QWT17569.1 glycosyltransferase family 2 protein [Collinsella sp. zg1085]